MKPLWERSFSILMIFCLRTAYGYDLMPRSGQLCLIQCDFRLPLSAERKLPFVLSMLITHNSEYRRTRTPSFAHATEIKHSRDICCSGDNWAMPLNYFDYCIMTEHCVLFARIVGCISNATINCNNSPLPL
ncbi:hypothetical protein Tcan_00141, partial [Toxocara canis]